MVSPDTEKEIQEVFRHLEKYNQTYYKVQALFAMAILKFTLEDQDDGISYLQTAFMEAKERGFFHFFTITRADLAKLSVKALELEIEGADYAAHLLANHLAAYAGPDLERLSRHANPRIAKKAQEVRQAIHRAGLPRLRLQTLGGLRLWRGDEEVGEKEWEGQQPKLLLKALLARGASRVHQDVLIEDLWPETSPQEGKRRFKVNLHRLRKTLEPRQDKTFGSSYLHLQGNLLSLDPELCEVDMHGFLSCYHEGRHQEEQGQVREALSSYNEAMTRYSGEFLAQEPYAL